MTCLPTNKGLSLDKDALGCVLDSDTLCSARHLIEEGSKGRENFP